MNTTKTQMPNKWYKFIISQTLFKEFHIKRKFMKKTLNLYQLYWKQTIIIMFHWEKEYKKSLLKETLIIKHLKTVIMRTTLMRTRTVKRTTVATVVKLLLYTLVIRIMRTTVIRTITVKMTITVKRTVKRTMIVIRTLVKIANDQSLTLFFLIKTSLTFNISKFLQKHLTEE